MKSQFIKVQFLQVVKLLQQANTQDAMLVNETSPAMVRFLAKDNIFRTLMLTDENSETKVSLTKSDDPDTALADFSAYIAGLLTAETNRIEQEKQKEKEQREKALAEARAHKKKLDSSASEKKEEEAPVKATKKKKVTKKKSTRKVAKKTGKKKTTKKSASKNTSKPAVRKTKKKTTKKATKKKK